MISYNFYGIYAEEDKKRFIKTQNNDFEKICEYLKTDPKTIKIIYNTYDTRDGKQDNDPNHRISRASARFDEMAIYRFWLASDDPSFPHEITHLIAHTWAKPYLWTATLDTAYGTEITKTIEMVSTSFFQEGLAIAVDNIVFKRKLLEEGEQKYIEEWCIESIDKIPKLINIINYSGFNAYNNKIVVPFAASISQYLINKYGLNKFKEIYVSIKETNTPEQNISIIEQIIQLEENELFYLWKKSLLQRNIRNYEFENNYEI